MSSSSALSRVPVLRILVPFVLGILVHGLWHSWWAPLSIIVVAVAGYACLSHLTRLPDERLRHRHLFILPIAMVALALGWLCAVIHCPPRLTLDQRNQSVMTGRITEMEYTDFSMRLYLDLLNPDLPRCRVLVSTRGCNYNLRCGDIMSWHSALDEVGNLGNPGEMDYARYLIAGKGVRYQQHLPVGRIERVGHESSFLSRMAAVRHDLELQVLNSRLSPPAQQFTIALLLGNSGFIDKATRAEFSAAGVAHVLALSGLHVGFIALIIWWLLFPLDYVGLKKLRLVITLAAITVFAVFSGLSPSVVRATVMIGFVFASLIFFRRSVSLNALMMAALVILLFSPSALYSVGFQLSFVTVAAVLLFARVPDCFKSRYQWVNRLTSIVITSMVALLATVALTAHYFHTISLMSVLSNLLILPVLPVFMVMAALFLLVTAAGMEWQLLNHAIDAIYRYIHWTASVVNGMPFSHLGGVYVSTVGVVAYFAVMALAVLWLYRRRFLYLLTAAFALAVLLGHSLWVDAHTARRGVVIFNSFTSTPLLYYNNGMGYVWTPDDNEPDSVAFSRYYAGFLARHSIDHLHFVLDGDTLRLDDAIIRPPYAMLMGRRMMAVGRGKWKSMTTSRLLDLDDIIVTKPFHGSAADLKRLYGFDRIIISGGLYENRVLESECDSLHLDCYNIARRGALAMEQSE